MKICIIKLGAKGDVVRTLPILEGIKEKFSDSEITWITRPSSKEILENSLYINKILTLPDSKNNTLNEISKVNNKPILVNQEPLIQDQHTKKSDNNLINNKINSDNNLNQILNEKFNILYNFDIEKEVTQLANNINADKKYGFYSDKKSNYVNSYNLAGEYYLNTIFDDEIKKTNKKTYQEMMFEIAEIPYKKQFSQIYLSEGDKKYATNFIIKNNLNINQTDKNKKLIGIHVGSDDRWPSKKWHLENLKEFIIKAKNKDYEILLFIGPDEKNYYDNLIKELNDKGIKIYTCIPNSDIEFFSLMNICDKIISSDSFALHSSLLLKKPTIGLFFCTPYNEIEDYGLLKKLVSPILYEFFPEKMDVYDENLTKSISAEEVLNALDNLEN